MMDYPQFQSVVDRLEGRFEADDNHARATCPVCESATKTKLRVSLIGDQIKACCFGGCKPADVYAAIEQRVGFSLNGSANGQPWRPDRKPVKWEVEYTHAATGGKRTMYRQSQWDPIKRAWDKRQWWSKGETPIQGMWPLWWVDGKPRLEPPEVDVKEVIICEGEKAARAVSRAGLVGMSYAGGCKGAAKWARPDVLQGWSVLIWADRDMEGARAAWACARYLDAGAAAEVRTMVPAGNDGLDAADLKPEQVKILVARAFDREPAPLDKLQVSDNDAEGWGMVLAGLYGERIRFNERTHEYEVNAEGGRQWKSADDEWLAARLDEIPRKAIYYGPKSGGKDGATYGWKPFHFADKTQVNHLKTLAYYSRRDGGGEDVRDWLDGLKWDGKSRIHDFLSDHFGAARTDLNKWASANLFMQMVRRTYFPGCPWRGITVLVGPQYSGKSTLVRLLLPDHLRRYHCGEMPLSAKPQERIEILGGMAVVELSEMHGLWGTDLSSLKAWIVATQDKARLAYRRSVEVVLRRCCFIGTMNDGEKIPNDPTGTTRWICVECPDSCDVEALMTDDYRDQLFAEAVAILNHSTKSEDFETGIPRRLTQAQAEVNEDFQSRNEVLYNLAQELAAGGSEGTAIDLAREAHLVEHDAVNMDKREQMEWTRALRDVGYKDVRKRVGNTRPRVWVLPEGNTPEPQPEPEAKVSIEAVEAELKSSPDPDNPYEETGAPSEDEGFLWSDG